MWKSCRFPHPRVENLWNGANQQPWNDRDAPDIARSEPARLLQHPPRPFEPDLLRQGGRPGLRTRHEVERGTGAQQAVSIEFIEASRRKQFLTWRTESDEAELGAGGADAVDRGVGL